MWLTELEPCFISFVIRFFVHLPIGFWGFTSQIYWRTIVDNSLGVLTDPTSFVYGLRVAGASGVSLFCWNLVSWLFIMYCKGLTLIMVGIADAAFVVLGVFALYFEASYLPHYKTQCGGAQTWMVPPGTNTSFFTAYGVIDPSTDDEDDSGGPRAGSDVCGDYFDIWVLGIAVMFLYSLSALSNLGLGLYSIKKTKIPSLADTAKFLWAIPKIVLIIVAFVLFLALMIVPTAIFVLLPASFQARWLFAYYYVKKVCKITAQWAKTNGQKLRRIWSGKSKSKLLPPKDEDVIDVVKLKPLSPPEKSLSQAWRSQPKGDSLSRLLYFDLLALIATDLHYIDVLNLSLASAGVRHVVFPPMDMASQVKRLKAYTCNEGAGQDPIFPKGSCWACRIQVCSGCRNTRDLALTPYVSHLERCAPCCSDCYLRKLCWPRARTQMYARRCVCPATATTGAKPRDLCLACVLLEDTELVATNERRARLDEAAAAAAVAASSSSSAAIAVAHSAGRPSPRHQCRLCRKNLPASGARWWVCTTCQGECRSEIHAAWAGKGDRGDHGKADNVDLEAG